ncbi:MAG TPA: hypothetical protein PLJ27_22795 [Polyangiaceae bacterium]|jgi:hypothetical protein|nr:MAG: hypothetical protein BWY17_01442 [Deltaproteobacteria bacterium ADurb.Bin207]HNZ20796.1 hypothetical protein [Polyangiaceae bacterium]HOD22672.1 hypothetical protein [Polyangiaceae bacterium]HOE48226.1 hypothetical protein [Polyangiaceae bacterium]HOH02928.1 hypothetical protein [Polyangiaceae bacterium]
MSLRVCPIGATGEGANLLARFRAGGQGAGADEMGKCLSLCDFTGHRKARPVPSVIVG